MAKVPLPAPLVRHVAAPARHRRLDLPPQSGGCSFQIRAFFRPIFVCADSAFSGFQPMVAFYHAGGLKGGVQHLTVEAVIN